MNLVGNIEIYIVCHDRKSYDWFIDHNKHIDISKFKFILVGEYEEVGTPFTDENIVASFYPDNIEQHKSLLTFTAWYLLSKNNIVKSDFVGIFEYDVIFKKDIFELSDFIDKKHIIGFNSRLIENDKFYLSLIPDFCVLLKQDEFEIAKTGKVWNATTNVIISKWFLDLFVNWYLAFIPHILCHPKVSHYHERAYNILMKYMNMRYFFMDSYLEHKQLMSHGISLQK